MEYSVNNFYITTISMGSIRSSSSPNCTSRDIFEGMSIRLGRWIACPDIEAQYAPDNYLASHSLLFTYDTYTQTGAMFSFQINQRNMIQGAIQSGTDMAPWYVGALADRLLRLAMGVRVK